MRVLWDTHETASKNLFNIYKKIFRSFKKNVNRDKFDHDLAQVNDPFF